MIIRIKVTQPAEWQSDGTLVIKGVSPTALAEAIIQTQGTQKFKLLKMLKEAMPPF